MLNASTSWELVIHIRRKVVIDELVLLMISYSLSLVKFSNVRCHRKGQLESWKFLEVVHWDLDYHLVI